MVDDCTRIGVFGGAYGNARALTAVLEDARREGAEEIFNLGDLGGFGIDVNGLWPLLKEFRVRSIAGNYDLALGYGEASCGCGHRDPSDSRRAQRIFDLTAPRVDRDFAAWMRTLPTELRSQIGGHDVLMVHGSPIEVNDFLWESLSDDQLRQRLDVAPGGRPDLMLCGHTGLAWHRRVDETHVVNVGAAGKPANNGSPDVAYAILDLTPRAINVNFRTVGYDWRAQAAEMRASGLPAECARTAETGWWPGRASTPGAGPSPATYRR